MAGDFVQVEGFGEVAFVDVVLCQAVVKCVMCIPVA
jgi:hypothetical protein